MERIVLRKALIEDAERILEIYGYYVKNTAVTFEYEVPTLQEFKNRMKGVMKKYPFLVALIDGRIEGYAYVGPFNERAAYDWSCETSIYVDVNLRRLGIGKVLYDALEKILAETGMVNLYACIACTERKDEYLTSGSVDFHRYFGYVTVGDFPECGYKFGRWYNVVYMWKKIGEKNDVKPVTRYLK